MLEFLIDIDKKLFLLINGQWTSYWADIFFPFITDLHKTPVFNFFVVPLIMAIFIWRRGLKKGVIIFFLCLSAIGASDGFGNWAFKKTIQRPRPGDTIGLSVQVKAPYGGYSFVSNHATNMFAFATYTSIIFPPSKLPLFALATLVAYSRVYNGVHFPLDVICGAILGSFFGFIFAKLSLRITTRIKEEEPPSP